MADVLILMKDERYKNALQDLFKKRMPNVELLVSDDIKTVRIPELRKLHLIICSSVIKDGIWLNILSLLKMAKNFILIDFPGGPAINDSVAGKYGALKLFKVPFSSGELFTLINVQMNDLKIEKEVKKEKKRQEQELAPNTEISDYFEMINDSNYYEMLAASIVASPDEIKKNYMELTKKFHPDRLKKITNADRIKAYEIIKRLNEAQSVLSNPTRRKLYDIQLRRNPKNVRFDFNTRVDPIDTIFNEQAKRFVSLAKEAAENKDYKQAILQLKLAQRMEKQNDYIENLISDYTKKI